MQREETRAVVIPPMGLQGTLMLPADASGVVLFAHRRSCLSPRNATVASALQRSGFGTLQLDLLTGEESNDSANEFDTSLLAERLLMATAWLRDESDLGDRPLGYFGAITGAAVLVAAAQEERRISAVVSRGGRPDLAGAALARVIAPTLLIVGSADMAVLSVNRAALAKLDCQKELAIVPGATHYFEEPSAQEAVITHTRRWFLKHMTPH